MYRLAVLPGCLKHAGIAINDFVFLEWEAKVRVELAARAWQRSRKHQTAAAAAAGPHAPDESLAEAEASQLRTGGVPSSSSRSPTTRGGLFQRKAPQQLLFRRQRQRNAADVDERPPDTQSLVEDPDPRKLAVCSKMQQRAIFSSMSSHQLIACAERQLSLIQKHTQQHQDRRKALQLKNQKIRRLGTQVTRLKHKLVLAKQSSDGELDVVRHRGRRLTSKGSLVLGLRKSLALVSASAFPLASLLETSRWTVVRCEVATWAHAMARSRCYHQCLYMLLRSLRVWCDLHTATNQTSAEDRLVSIAQPSAGDMHYEAPQLHAMCKDLQLPVLSTESVAAVGQSLGCLRGGGVEDGSTFTLGATFWSGDATNSLWQQQKLQGLEVSSTIMANARALESGEPLKAFRTLRCMQLYIQSTSVWFWNC